MAKWDLLNKYLAQVSESVTLTWPELEAIVGPLPDSAKNHRPWWSGDRPHVNSWKSAGFQFSNLQMGSQVTFTRVGTTPQKVAPVAQSIRPFPKISREALEPRTLPDVDLLLVSCVKTKRKEASSAKDLYTSSLFQKEREYAENRGVPWFILSAEYGLVAPDTRIEPYEKYLPNESPSYRAAWGRKVVADLEKVAGSLSGKAIEVHAGVVYLEAIRSDLQVRGASIYEPLHGLPMGKRLQWYGTNQSVKKTEMGSQLDLPDTESLVSMLRDHSLAQRPSEFLAGGSSDRKVPGLYSWWVDDLGAVELSEGLGHKIEPGMIYAGLAGATHWPSGKPSNNTLWLRIATMHLGTNHEFSTFRRTIGAILANVIGVTKVDEVALTKWMENHLRVRAVPYENADLLGRVEEAVLERLDPPLNLKGMEPSELRSRLKELRRVVSS